MLKGSYFTTKELLKLNFKSIGRNVKIDKTVMIPNTNNIEIGNNVRIDAFSIISSGKGNIIINDHVLICPQNLIYCSNNHNIILEKHSGLAAGCKLYGRTENYDGRFLMNPTHNDEDIELIEGDIILNKFSTLGCETTVFPNSIIPIGTILGSKSLYTGKNELEEWSIYAGNPLKYFRKRSKNSLELSKKYN